MTKVSKRQSEQIAIGIVNHLDISKYSDASKYTWKQMMQIRLGLESGVDVSKYSDSKLSSSCMEEFRLWLEAGLDPIPYYDKGYSIGHMVVIRKCLKRGEDVSYINPMMDISQVNAAVKDYHDGIDPTFYLAPYDDHFDRWKTTRQLGLSDPKLMHYLEGKQFELSQVLQIKKGLDQHLNVDIYAKTCYDDDQMREIRLGLKEGLDVTSYANPDYDSNEMFRKRAILFGVEEDD